MEKTIKKSRQREAMLTILRGTTCHPDANWLYEQLKAKFPRISLATVYRNLALLLETGDIIKLDVGNGTEHYDGTVHTHYHFVCDTCKAIYDVDIPVLAELDQTAGNVLDAEVKNHSLIFYGTCHKCKN